MRSSALPRKKQKRAIRVGHGQQGKSVLYDLIGMKIWISKSNILPKYLKYELAYHPPGEQTFLDGSVWV